MKICVLFDNLGPYHIARLNALSGLCTLTAIERRSKSTEYLWQQEKPQCFACHTLTDASHNPIAIRKQVHHLLETIKPDVIAVPGWAGLMTICATEWGYLNHTPVIVMSDSQEIDFPRQRLGEWIKGVYLSCCSAAFVAGQPHADYIRKLAHQPIAITNGYDVVDNDYFSQHAESAISNARNVRETYGLPDHYFLASARFIEKKNLLRLIQAFAEFKKACPPLHPQKDWKLVLLGEGELRSDIEACIEEAGMKDQVMLPGFKQYPDLPAYYALAEAFILASTTEQWGLVVNEAMACGLPVIVSNRCGCALDLVKNGTNGYQFDPFAIDEMKCALANIARMPDAKSVMGAASKKIISQFSTSTFASNLVQLAIQTKAHPALKPTLLRLLIIKLLLCKEAINEWRN